jgi:ferredoxin
MKIARECVGCGQCAAYCPFDAIDIFGRAVKNKNCIGCEQCIDYCPVGAIVGEK